MGGTLTSLLSLLGIAKSPAPSSDVSYEVADVYRDLRKQVFAVKPEAIGVKRDGDNRVWGVVMESGASTGVATLVALADGTVSLYFSGGGGVIGLGRHEGPRRAAQELLRASQQYLPRCSRTASFPLPEDGMITFYLMSFAGVFLVEGKENELAEDRLPLSPLFWKAQDVITQARLVDEKRDPSRR